MENHCSENSKTTVLHDYDYQLQCQNSFLDFGLSILSSYNEQKFHHSILILDALKEKLLENPENRFLKLKFQLKLDQLKSIISTKKRIDLLNLEIKNLKYR